MIPMREAPIPRATLYGGIVAVNLRTESCHFAGGGEMDPLHHSQAVHLIPKWEVDSRPGPKGITDYFTVVSIPPAGDALLSQVCNDPEVDVVLVSDDLMQAIRMLKDLGKKSPYRKCRRPIVCKDQPVYSPTFYSV